MALMTIVWGNNGATTVGEPDVHREREVEKSSVPAFG